jgi:hypothetical protein
LEKSEKKVHFPLLLFINIMCISVSRRVHSNLTQAANLKRREQRERRPLALYFFLSGAKNALDGQMGISEARFFPHAQIAALEQQQVIRKLQARRLNISLDIHWLIISAAHREDLMSTAGANVGNLLELTHTRMQLSTKGQFAFSHCNRTLCEMPSAP